MNIMKYVALLRGIGPGNPNMRNDKLRGVFEKLGFKNVRTVISSGNVIFESSSKNARALEDKIEKALPKKLGFKAATIIRSKEDLQKLVDKDPFKGAVHNKKTYLIITFFKNKPKIKLKYDRAVANVIDVAAEKTPDFMVKLEKQFGKEITTRTWKTVTRILDKMQD